jgi:hypothetical protein
MATVQRIAQLIGWVLVLFAIWGGVRAGMSMETDPALAPAILGVFPVNFPHNLLHLAIGLWGIRAAGTRGAALAYAVLAGVVFLVLAVVGLFAPSGFGLLPLGGGSTWLHAGLGVGLLAIGRRLGRVDAGPTVQPAATRTVMPPPPGSPPGRESTPEPREDGPGDPATG